MNSKKLQTLIEWSIFSLFTISLIVIIIEIICYFLGTENLKILDNFGGFAGGVIGTAIAGTVLYFVKKTFYLQSDELKATREYLNKQQFESVYFKMLDMINEIGKNMKQEIWLRRNNEFQLIQTHTGNYFFVHIMGCLEKAYFSRPDMNLHNFIVTEILNIEPGNEKFQYPTNIDAEDERRILTDEANINSWGRDNIEEYLGILYKYYFFETYSQLGHFFRYIYNAIQYAIAKRKEYDDEKFYINLIQAQLSNNQLAVMFYNCLSPASKNSEGKYEFREILDTYNVFHNLQKNMLLDEKHQDFYPKTVFKDSYKNVL